MKADMKACFKNNVNDMKVGIKACFKLNKNLF